MRGVSEGAFTRSDFVTQTGADADVMARLDAYAATLAAWNETHSPSRSCECRIESRTRGAGWLGLLLLLGVRARSRSRAR